MTAAARPEISHQRRLPNIECVVSLAIAEKRITNLRRVDRAQLAKTEEAHETDPLVCTAL